MFAATLGKTPGPRESLLSEAAWDGVDVRPWCEEEQDVPSSLVCRPRETPRPPFALVTSLVLPNALKSPLSFLARYSTSTRLCCEHSFNPIQATLVLCAGLFLININPVTLVPNRAGPAYRRRDARPPGYRRQARHLPCQADHRGISAPRRIFTAPSQPTGSHIRHCSRFVNGKSFPGNLRPSGSRSQSRPEDLCVYRHTAW